ncbi:MAG TPA: phosphoribosyltransferase family protein, partial [Gaiellaceae bacterium]|nr:phosphoribosyltransferase family protein [Gaiellaceae bacterium]
MREVMTWDDLGRGSRELAEAVYADGYVPDMVLAIARGGLLVAGALGYALGVKNTFTMNVEFYTGVDERLELPMLLPPVPDLVDFAETQVLIA